MDDSEYYQGFNHPKNENYPANYWFWQRIPTQAEIDAQLGDMVQKGFKTFFIQPRLAFPLEKYMGPEYLDAYARAMKAARALGLTAGIYDEYNWNSGHAGGLTVKGHDEFREKQLFWTSAQIQSLSFSVQITDIESLMGDTLGDPQAHWTYEGGKPWWDQWAVFRVIAYPDEFDFSSDGAVRDLTEFCAVEAGGEDGCRVSVSLPAGDYAGLKLTAFITARCVSSRHINYLDAGATRRFIEVGYEPYRRAVGEYFGTTLVSIFMDHPHAGFYRWAEHEGGIENSLMFDPTLVETFQSEHGYPIEWAILSFLLPLNPRSAKMRGDFFYTYGTLARKNFLGQISGWARQNGLKFTGHELFSFIGTWGFVGGFATTDHRTDFGGDYFGIGRYKDISAVDAFNSNPQIDAKMGDSVARANGSHGCLLEQYYYNVDPGYPGVIGHWNLTYAEMRAQALRHTLMGMKQFIFHGYYLSDTEGGDALLASSRFDFAPGINYEPWFAHFATFAQEIARLSAFIYNAEPATEVGLLYPLASFWTAGSEGSFGPQSAFWNQWLSENGINYDVVNENQLSFSVRHPGRIQAGSHSYSVLILPGVSALMTRRELDAICDFVLTGGLLLVTGEMPKATVETGQDDEIIRRLWELVREYPNAVFLAEGAGSEERIAALIAEYNPGMVWVVYPNKEKNPVWTWTGTRDDACLVVLFNDHPETRRVSARIPLSAPLIERWDVHTGEKTPWVWFERSQLAAVVWVDLKPGELACFSASRGAAWPGAHLENPSLPVIDARGVDGRAKIALVGEKAGEAEYTLASAAGTAVNRVSLPKAPEALRLDRNWTVSFTRDTAGTPVDISRGWETQGWVDTIGAGHYATRFDLSRAQNEWAQWKLAFVDIGTVADVRLNGVNLGELNGQPYETLVPEGVLREQDNQLEVTVYNTAGNRFYHGTPYAGIGKAPSGILGAPSLKPVNLIRVGETA